MQKNRVQLQLKSVLAASWAIVCLSSLVSASMVRSPLGRAATPSRHKLLKLGLLNQLHRSQSPHRTALQSEFQPRRHPTQRQRMKTR